MARLRRGCARLAGPYQVPGPPAALLRVGAVVGSTGPADLGAVPRLLGAVKQRPDGLRWRPSCRWRARHHAGGRAAGRPEGQHPARPGLRSRAPRRSGRAPAPWPPGTRGQRTEQQKGPGRRRRDEEENGLPAGPGHVGSDQTAAEPLATRRCLAHDRPVHADRLDRFIACAPV